jgi:hypothetical protein
LTNSKRYRRGQIENPNRTRDLKCRNQADLGTGEHLSDVFAQLVRIGQCRARTRRRDEAARFEFDNLYLDEIFFPEPNSPEEVPSKASALLPNASATARKVCAIGL